MSEIQNILLSREIPDIFCFSNGSPVTAENFEERRKEILSILSNEIYGTAPEYNGSVRATVVKREEKQYAGKGTQTSLVLTVDTDMGEFSFPIVEIVPSGERKYPTFVMLNFRPDVPDKYLPIGFRVSTTTFFAERLRIISARVRIFSRARTGNIIYAI